MMLFSFPEQDALAERLGITRGKWEWRHFPDGESYVRVLSQVQGRKAIILCSLNQPDAKLLPLVFLASVLRQLGAARVTLLSPYLGYMRQDKAFQPGEAITSEIIAPLLSRYIDALVTIDPHLHRHASLSELYGCECSVLSAAPLIGQWVKQQVAAPLIIGPDAESSQWVEQAAAKADAPYVVLQKQRRGDREVSIDLPDISQYAGRTPVLVDDIISTAATMIKTLGLLGKAGFSGAVCAATHGLFAGDAYGALQRAGAAQIITTNTVAHASNAIDVSTLLGQGLYSP